MYLSQPPFRKLRGYAFDPSLSLHHDTVGINEVTYHVDWESISAGPVGEYLEVVDYDPTIEQIYMPVDLNDSHILATDGLSPSESNPLFHQQMVYAVAMTTIKNFEAALGRKAIWNPRRTGDNFQYVGKLRVYPHALREANAFYSPEKKALLFGYFSATPGNVTQHMPGGLVFTCLSHDIIAHETSHALLDGMHSSYTTPTNPDVLAFHEAFADIVALFQHFTFPDVLKHQIARTQGDLDRQNLLGQLAQQFGRASGHYGSLRDAIGTIDEYTKEWKPRVPDPREYEQSMEPHARGSILVAAVFDAFLSIYKMRVADLLRIATGGTGILPQGELHPDLVNRLAAEASKSATHVLRMCVRALDYSPTTDITFGDYLRAIITADCDLFGDDARNYRLAFIDAFRRRGIYPSGIQTLSVDSLIYRAEELQSDLETRFGFLGEYLREFRNQIFYLTDREQIFRTTNAFIAGTARRDDRAGGSTPISGLHERLWMKFDNVHEFEALTGLMFSEGWHMLGIRTSQAHGFQGPRFQVHSLKLANRVGPQGKVINHIVLTLTQKAWVRCSRTEDGDNSLRIEPVVFEENRSVPEDAMEVKGSCTLIVDLDSLKLKYVISKPLLDVEHIQPFQPRALNRARIERQFEFMYENSQRDDFAAYFSGALTGAPDEPFAFLHRAI